MPFHIQSRSVRMPKRVPFRVSFTATVRVSYTDMTIIEIEIKFATF